MEFRWYFGEIRHGKPGSRQEIEDGLAVLAEAGNRLRRLGRTLLPARGGELAAVEPLEAVLARPMFRQALTGRKRKLQQRQKLGSMFVETLILDRPALRAATAKGCERASLKVVDDY